MCLPKEKASKSENTFSPTNVLAQLEVSMEEKMWKSVRQESAEFSVEGNE